MNTELDALPDFPSESGLPIGVVRAAPQYIKHGCAEAYRAARQARPEAAALDWRDPLTRRGQAVWSRRGDVFAVHAPGNHPTVHSERIQALALGYRVAARPSRREPFTPHRLVSPLWEAGFSPGEVVLLPTSHEVAGHVLRGADLSMVYGGGDLVRIHSGDAFVLPPGPGRSKILLTRAAVSNVYVGDQPTWRMDPSIPHDGYLAEFLMRTKLSYAAGHSWT